MPRRLFLQLLGAVQVSALVVTAQGQVVDVTANLDDPVIGAGQSTTLRVFAQVVPGQRAGADRIFSWYVDLLNSGASVARADYAQLAKPASDQDPLTSSAGTTVGSNRIGIYDTFLNVPGAGVSEPVELLSVPVEALAQGTATFQVRPGSGVSSLSSDFIVAPVGGGDPLLGGQYTQASVQLMVTAVQECFPLISISRADSDGAMTEVTLDFSLCPGRDHFVESTDNLTAGTWQPLPGAPHNSGSVTDTAGAEVRFYRVRTETR